MRDKFVIVTALAFSDQQDTKRLSEFASKGLLLNDYRIPLLSYRLIPQEKQEVDFLIDYHRGSAQEYVDSYIQNGWDHVFSHVDLHYFKAAKGTAPFYTDIEGKVMRYKKESKRFGMYTLISLIPTLVFGYLLFTFQSSEELVTLPLFIISGISVMTLIFCIMPFVTYHFRAKRLTNNV
ncbi:MAG: DUF2812 domain-containing protein [Erysipelotrichaceae bacterium]|nr:DUF2812 domain-containing protein [Erysipelotrichaceae bacterium]